MWVGGEELEKLEHEGGCLVARVYGLGLRLVQQLGQLLGRRVVGQLVRCNREQLT